MGGRFCKANEDSEAKAVFVLQATASPPDTVGLNCMRGRVAPTPGAEDDGCMVLSGEKHGGARVITGSGHSQWGQSYSGWFGKCKGKLENERESARSAVLPVEQLTDHILFPHSQTDLGTRGSPGCGPTCLWAAPGPLRLGSLALLCPASVFSRPGNQCDACPRGDFYTSKTGFGVSFQVSREP